jgi:hypothetical protein
MIHGLLPDAVAGRYDVDGLATQVDVPDSAPVRGTVLVVAPFGVSADSLFMPAYVLARNGFRVVRFDSRDHVGLSPGGILDYRMSTVVDDIQTMLRWTAPDHLLGFSLAGPPAFRALRNWGQPVPAVFAAGVVDTRQCLRAVLGFDLFEQAEPSERLVVLGETVNVRQFSADCRRHRMVEYEDSLTDLAQVPGPVVMIAGTGDPWVRYDEVTGVAGHRQTTGAGPTSVVPVPVGTHQFNLNPTVAMTYTKVILSTMLSAVGADPRDCRIPALKEMISARRQVRDAVAAGAGAGAEER